LKKKKFVYFKNGTYFLLFILFGFQDAIIDSFKRFLMQEKYDFDFIFSTTTEAVRHARRLMEENQEIQVIVTDSSVENKLNEKGQIVETKFTL
jgi:hypothetical protein